MTNAMTNKLSSKLFKILMSAWLTAAPILVTLCAPVTAHSQAATFPTQPQCTVVLPATATTATTAWINLSTPQCQDVHYFTLTFYPIGTVSTCQMKSQQATDTAGTGAIDLIANQTCTGTGVTSTSAALTAGFGFVNISLGTKSGTGTVLGILNGYRQNPYGTINVAGSITPSGTQNVNVTQVAGQPTATNGNGVIAVAGAASSGLIVITAACSGATCYTSPVKAGAIVIASGSTSTLFAATTALDTGSFCNNQTASSVTLTVTDGNNAYIHGPTFSIPAFGYLSFNDIQGSVFTSGVKMSASASSAIVCWMNGKQ